MATKAELEQLQAENDALKAAQAAQATQNDQVLDYLAELKEEVTALKAGQGTAAPVSKLTEEDRFAAEWAKLKDEFANVPNIQVLEHRIVDGADAPAAIRLKCGPAGILEPSIVADPHGETCYWKLRWFNFAIEGRAERFANEGYLKVEREELADPDGIPNLVLTDRYVRKGDQGREVLGKIPRKLFEFKKRRDAWRAGRLMTSESGLRDHVSAHVATMAGNSGGNADQAGSTVHDKFNLTITPQEKERVTI